MSNLSAGYLSQVEQDKKIPSLMALTGIAEVLEINPRYLLEPEENQVNIVRANLKPENLSFIPSIVSTELTSAVSGTDLEVHRLILQPEAPNLEFEPHSGETLGFVLEGKVIITFEDQRIELEAGDSIHYDANQVYSLTCQGDQPCVVIWCNSPRQTDFEAKIRAVTVSITGIPAAIK